MDNKKVLITGSARGMGRVTAMALAQQGADVLIVDWEGEEGTRTREAINAACGRPAAEFIYCDLSSLTQVRALAAQVRQRFDTLDVLINNAGITDPVRRLSEDGNEMHLATCHLSHFLLTHELLLLLQAAEQGRIICISSDAHKAGPGLDFDDINNEKLWAKNKVSNNAAFQSYHRAKLSNLYFTRVLTDKLAGTSVTVNAVSPGYFVNTTIHRQLTGVFALGAGIVFGIGTLFGLNTPEKGARTHIWLASTDEIPGRSGGYFEHCKPKTVGDIALDDDAAQRLWQVSEKLTGITW